MKLTGGLAAFLALLLFGARAFAQLSFPMTPLLDNFDRANAGPPGGAAWISSLSTEFPGHDGISVINNKAAGQDIAESYSSSWATMFPQDQEAYYEYGDRPGVRAGMGPAVRLQNPADFQSDQYLVFFYQRATANQSDVIIWKRYAGAWSSLKSGTISTDLNKGDQIGLRAVGAEINAYLNGQLVLSTVDAQPILKPGYLQLYVGDDVGHTADNFGGGAVFGDSVPPDPAGAPGVLSPTPGSTLSGESQTFQWTANGESVGHWWISVGTTQGAWDIADIDQGTNLSARLVGLPVDGRPIWVRLWYLVDGVWLGEDFSYTTSSTTSGGGTPEVLSPALGSTLLGESQAFEWAANGESVGHWWISVGTTQGAWDIADIDQGTNLSATLVGLPVTGRPIWVRLWYLVDGVWLGRDMPYTAASN